MRGLLYTMLSLFLVVGGFRTVKVAFSPAEAAQPARAQPRPIDTWPDDQARAVAVDFARDYWTRDPDHPDRYESELRGDVTSALAGNVTPTWPENTRLQAAALTVASARKVTASLAVVTVSATVQVDRHAPERLYLDVPVARAGDALTVAQLPSIVAGPASARVPDEEGQPLPPDEALEIDAMLKRFFTAYLAGDTQGLEFYTAPGVTLQAAATPVRLGTLGLVTLTSEPVGDRRDLTVDLTATLGDAVLPQRYRVRLERGDRWYVAAPVNPGGTR